MTQPSLVIVTGLSGAGKSIALAALEDIGFFCVDNLPTPVIQATLEAFRAKGVERIGLGVDVRVRGFLADATGALDDLARAGAWQLSVLYLDASDEALLRRFSSTRRPHPLSAVGPNEASTSARALLDGISTERALLAPLRARSGVVWDTTGLTVHQLRQRILEHFAVQGAFPRLMARLISFGFKYGAPVDADMLFDVRFLDNPFFVEHLRDHSGLEPEVRTHVLDSADAQGLIERAVDLLEFCLPRFEKEGKSYLTVGVGCTGGRHRSVVVAEQMARLLASGGSMIDVVHRDIRRVEDEQAESDGIRVSSSLQRSPVSAALGALAEGVDQ